ncbi:MAG: hypothetical protein EXQ58_08280 [Acidobacteria bacterium]|nr:hypothetical protein [Acidobacteriota bacterium]
MSLLLIFKFASSFLEAKSQWIQRCHLATDKLPYRFTLEVVSLNPLDHRGEELIRPHAIYYGERLGMIKGSSDDNANLMGFHFW